MAATTGLRQSRSPSSVQGGRHRRRYPKLSEAGTRAQAPVWLDRPFERGPSDLIKPDEMEFIVLRSLLNG